VTSPTQKKVNSVKENTYEKFALLGYYAASGSNLLPTFRGQPIGTILPNGCPETSVINYKYSLRNNAEERSSQLLRGVKPEITPTI